jgi:CspA family cold shock protein
MSLPHGFKSKLYNWWVKYCPLPKFLRLERKVCSHVKSDPETKISSVKILKKVNGVVTKFGAKGYGFILGDDDEKYFVHRNNIYNKLPLTVDTRVEFQAESSEKGLSAINVELEKSNATASQDDTSEAVPEKKKEKKTVKANTGALSKNKLSKMTKKDLLVFAQDMDVELPKKSSSPRMITKAVIIKIILDSQK